MHSIAGWAYDESNLDLTLTAWVNGAAVASFPPSLVRPDITHLSRNNVGFEVTLAKALTPTDVVGVTNERGDHLSRSPRKALLSDWTKEEKALCFISRDMKILEVGPGYSPLTPRSKGWNSFSLDHATKEELEAKYRGHQPIALVEPVDYVWRGGPLEAVIPSENRNSFDAVIASHVIEHLPNPIAFFLFATSVLKPGGLVSLVIPDKRFSFDFFKPLTMTSDYLCAHDARRTRHSKKTAFDYMAYNVSESGQIGWSTRLVGDFSFNCVDEDQLMAAKRRFDNTIEDESGPYVDYHATIYTPSSFALIIFELGQLGVLPFHIEHSFPTSGCEFYATLRHRTPERLPLNRIQEERIRLMKEMVRETSQQGRWLLDEA